MSKTTGTVYVLTHSPRVEDHTANLLALDSVQVGFPNFDVVVVDRASCPPVRASLIHETDDDFDLVLLDDASHAEAIRSIIRKHATSKEPVAIINGDVKFWDNCENWKIDGLLAGRRIPTFYDEINDVVVNSRLHPSFLIIPRPDKLAKRIANADERWPGDDLYSSVTYFSNRWERYELLGLLCEELEDEAVPFTEEQLDSYDCLLYEGEVSDMEFRLVPDDRRQMGERRTLISTDLEGFRGSWREQQEFYESRAV